MSGNSGGHDWPPMPRDPGTRPKLPRDPGGRTKWLGTFTQEQRRYMHWYLDHQVVLVQKLFYEHYRDRRLKLQLNIAMMQVQEILDDPNAPATGQPQQVLNGYTTSETYLLYQYARKEVEDLQSQLEKRFKASRKAKEVNKALLELRNWLVNEHVWEPEDAAERSTERRQAGLQSLITTLAAVNVPPAQKQAALRESATSTEQYEAWLKGCYMAKHEPLIEGRAPAPNEVRPVSRVLFPGAGIDQTHSAAPPVRNIDSDSSAEESSEGDNDGDSDEETSTPQVVRQAQQAQQASQKPSLIWDSQRRVYYYYDARTREVVLQDGRRAPAARPPPQDGRAGPPTAALSTLSMR